MSRNTVAPSTTSGGLKEAILYERKEKMMDVEPTDRELLLHAWEIGKNAGLHHVYCGNLPALHEDTLCYNCGKTMIQRVGFNVEFNRLDRGHCPFCHTAIHGVWDGEVARAITPA